MEAGAGRPFFMPKEPKLRLDQLLVDAGLARDLKDAGALVLSGAVFSGDTALRSVAERFEPTHPLRVRGRGHRVSRSGVKLLAALEAWNLDVKGKRCLDAGASTGGFTQVLLERGATCVYSVEKGHRQLAHSLSKDPRVHSLEGVDLSALNPQDLDGQVDFMCADLSFVATAPLLVSLASLLRAKGAWVLLVKPQFELPVKQVPAGGVVRDPLDHARAVELVWQAAESAGLAPSQKLTSPLKGSKGNQEFLIMGQKL